MTSKAGPTLPLTSLSEEAPVNHSPSPGCERPSKTPAGNSLSHILRWLNGIAPSGWYGRTFPASCRLTEDGRLEPSSGHWLNSGMGSPGGCLTLNTCEWTAFAGQCPSDGDVSSLSDILEDHGSVPRKYYLSQKACQGILRRAEKRGKALPRMLHLALSQVAAEWNE